MRPTPSAPSSATVDAAITSRRSVRAYLPTLVPWQVVEDNLRIASRAAWVPKTQPCRVTVLGGEAKTALSAKIGAVFENPVAPAQRKDEYDYCQTEWRSPYIERRRKVGWDLYGMSLGHADPAAIASRLVTEREVMAGFTRFLG
jgi:nitroreductase